MLEKIICNIYHPFIDDDHSLWGMDNSILKRSPDYGDSWDTVFDFSVLGNGIGIPPIFGCIYISKTGYVFVGLKDSNNGQGYLYRSTTPRLLKDNNAGLQFQLIFRFHKGGFTNPWNITEDREGVIYIGEYGHKYTGSEDEFGNEIPIGYVYKSTDNGLTFQTIDYFITSLGGGFSARHIHQIQVNPYNNKLYITIGDHRKEDYVSTDKGQTFTKIYGPIPQAGHTGLGFFPDCRLLGTDFVNDGNPNPGSRNYSNYIRKTTDDVNFNNVLSLLTDPYNTAFYDLVTLTDHKTAFAVTHDEWNDQETKCSSIWKTTDRGDTWELLAETEIGSKAPVFMGLAHGRSNVIPEGFPYLIINNHWTRADLYPPEGEMFLGRILIQKEPITKIVFENTLPMFLNSAKLKYEYAILPIYPDETCTTPDNSVGTIILNQVNSKEWFMRNDLLKEAVLSIVVKVTGTLPDDTPLSLEFESVKKLMQPGEVQNFPVDIDLTGITGFKEDENGSEIPPVITVGGRAVV